MLDKDFKLIKNVSGLRCSECQQFIWSKYRHDFHYCNCGCCFVDGGRDYFRAGYSPDKKLPETETYDILIDLKTGYETLLPRSEGGE